MEQPQPGQSVIVRNRPALVRDVTASPASGQGGPVHLVEVEYLDGAEHPDRESILWEREIGARVLSALRLPQVDDPSSSPSPPDSFGALLDALRWSSMGRSSLLTGGDDGASLVSPWMGAVQVEDYQLYPVLKAMTMPRVSLFLADDVGLGKTIEAALITAELIARRRIRRILVMCPAALQIQWRDELREKFSLEFTIMGRDEEFRIQRELGMDANPWATTPRIITSMDYLRQADVVDRFLRAAEGLEQQHRAMVAWDLVIVDEVHNLTPSRFADDSQRCRMLREIVPHFEHRLFLTATPHNGYTQSFSGLLELLDPVRFQQTATLDDDDHAQISTVMVRRLKSELNARSTVPRFPTRHVDAVPVTFSGNGESALFAALADYREQGARLAGRIGGRELQLARFLFSILTKRLLSSSYAFARTWWSHIVGYELDTATYDEVRNAATRAQADVTDDEERARREEDAVRQGAAWLKASRGELSSARQEVSDALTALGWTAERLEEPFEDKEPPPDARWDALWGWIKDNLRDGDQFRDDERLILFTEYKDTLHYLLWRLQREGHTSPMVLHLFGGMSLSNRELIKQEFNDPGSALRILVATDAASEGLNFQESCRYVFHQEIPWNPMRLEQRNGRVDRHGQARDPYVYHFKSDEEADLAFLDRVARKVSQVREDLGNVGQVIDASIEEHFTKQRIGADEFERRVDTVGEAADASRDQRQRDAGGEEEYRRAVQALRAAELQLGLTPNRMARILRLALKNAGGDLLRDDEASTDAIDVHRIRPVPPTWEKLIEESVRIRKGDQASALPKIVFDATYFERTISGRSVFRPRPDAILVRLGHPLMRRALSTFKRRLWQEGDEGRWTILGAPFPSGTDAVLVLHALCSATNELRETIHEEVRSWPFLVEADKLSDVDPAYWEELSRLRTSPLAGSELTGWRGRIGDLWLDHRDHLEEHLTDYASGWEARLSDELAEGIKAALKTEQDAYEKRLAEIDTERNPETIEKLRRQLEKAARDALQRTFDEETNAEMETRLRELEQELAAAEWDRQHSHRMLLKERLQRERDRVLGEVLPLRYSLARVDVQPVAVEYRVRHVSGGGE